MVFPCFARLLANRDAVDDLRFVYERLDNRTLARYIEQAGLLFFVKVAVK